MPATLIRAPLAAQPDDLNEAQRAAVSVSLIKALAWQDADGNVWLSYNDPAYLKQRFGLTDNDVKGIAGAGNLIDEALK